MESYALFIIVDTHRSSKHKVVKYILPDLYVIVIIVVIVDTIIIISQARGNADKVKAYLILQESCTPFPKIIVSPALNSAPSMAPLLSLSGF